MKDTGAGEPRASEAGGTVRLAGWVQTVRDMGGIVFFDLRDSTGLIQVVDDNSVAPRLHGEDVVAVEGELRRRPEGTENPELPTGEVEVGARRVEVLNRAATPPFPVDDRTEAGEELRLRYRYIDLRRPRMQANLRLRAAVNGALRRSMEEQGFLEVETPHLTASTPEGARDYLVPSRTRPGAFYALPQSPQQFKQLLMVAGFERYYQIARCYRDEDQRGNRQAEFTQLDVELSFCSEDDVMTAVETAVAVAVEDVTGERLRLPLPRMTWSDAMDRYGTDKPDVRFGLEIHDLSHAFVGTSFRAFAEAEAVRGIRVPGRGVDASRSFLDGLVARAQELGARGLVWAMVEAEVTLRSPVAKFLSSDEQGAVIKELQAEAGDLVLVVADAPRLASKVLGQFRLELAGPGPSQPPSGPWEALWVVEFPAFTRSESTGQIESEAHPFTGLHEGELDLLERDPLAMRSRHYDLVMNGEELGSGSVRIHDRALLERVFGVLGLAPEEAGRRFGHMLTAFEYGAPPHGGFAIGLDRFYMLLAGERAIREVIAFPKTQQAFDPMTGAPTPVDAAQLAELGIRVVLPPKG